MWMDINNVQATVESTRNKRRKEKENQNKKFSQIKHNYFSLGQYSKGRRNKNKKVKLSKFMTRFLQFPIFWPISYGIMKRSLLFRIRLLVEQTNCTRNLFDPSKQYFLHIFILFSRVFVTAIQAIAIQTFPSKIQ